MRTAVGSTRESAGSESANAPGRTSLVEHELGGSSGGAPLPDATKTKFESSLGTDLSGVRVHTGADSAASAKEHGARAYTLWEDIHFADGQYDPDSAAGEHLLAHEVAHTVQQRGDGGARQQAKLEMSSSGDADEVEADRAADAMVAGQRASVGGGMGGRIQRKEDGAPAQGVTARTAGSTVEWGVPLHKAPIGCGLVGETSLAVKAEVLGGKDGAPSKGPMGTAGIKTKEGKIDLSLVKGEVEKKMGPTGAGLKGSIDATTAGINPAVELALPLDDKVHKIEFAPWKFKSDGVKLMPVTAKLPFFDAPVETDHYKLRVQLNVQLEASVDIVELTKFVAKRYGPVLEAEAAAIGLTEALLVGAVVAGAVLATLDYIDQERRANLRTETVARAQQIISGEHVFMTALAGRKVAARGPVEQRALAEANRVRAALATRTKLDPDTVEAIAGKVAVETWDTFSWRDKKLDELKAKLHAGLDAYAKQHEIRSLWGLRTDDDKKNVTKWIEAIRADPQSMRLGNAVSK